MYCTRQSAICRSCTGPLEALVLIDCLTSLQATYFGAYEVGKVLTQPLRARGHGVAADMATGLLQQTAAGILFTP